MGLSAVSSDTASLGAAGGLLAASQAYVGIVTLVKIRKLWQRGYLGRLIELASGRAGV